MQKVNITELRNHLPDYLAKAVSGQTLVITSRGRIVARLSPPEDMKVAARKRLKQLQSNRSHSLAADRLLQGFNRGQIAPKCVFPTDYALKPEKGCWLSGGKVNNYATEYL